MAGRSTLSIVDNVLDRWREGELMCCDLHELSERMETTDVGYVSQQFYDLTVIAQEFIDHPCKFAADRLAKARLTAYPIAPMFGYAPRWVGYLG